MALRTGKLPPELLRRMLRHAGAPDDRVLLGPKVGEDAALVRLGPYTLVLKTDPVTYASDMIGWYAVNVNANDVATRGAQPAWFQAAVLLPVGSDEALVESIFSQISEAAKALGIAVTGGHTEVTPGIDRPIVVGDMHGVLVGGSPVLTSGAEEGDSLVLTKGAGIEGTALIAREKRDELLKALDRELVDRAANYLTDPGLSVVLEAGAALEFGVHSMHDPTEGGVAMGVREIAEASGRSIELWADEVFVGRETEMICAHYGLDPLGLLGSGALLAAFKKEDASAYVAALGAMGVKAKVVGRVGGQGSGSMLVRGGESTPLSSSERDEVLKVL
ncbi:MAG: AIR synthase family protein [Thermoplasmata archaeon]